MSAFDAIVIGAGPAGSTSALRLSSAGWAVAIVEKAGFPRRKVCGEFVSAPAWGLLDALGVADRLIPLAGPEIHEVAVYAAERSVAAPMPTASPPYVYGRALGRELLDTTLLDAARCAGAAVFQPCRVRSWTQRRGRYVCRLQAKEGESEIDAPILIAAHGSWDTGGLPAARGESDLLAFKAHFSATKLPHGRMPLIAFPGGYGGLVHTDGGRTSFSCCIRRRALEACRAERRDTSAGAAVAGYVLSRCRDMRDALADAVREGPWLAAGPLRIGVRSVCADGFFAAGNAMAEAHPIVAEGISMAIQSGWLLSEALIEAGPDADRGRRNEIAQRYEAALRANFAMRMRAAALVAGLAMRPLSSNAATHVLNMLPGLLAFGARCAGKARTMRAVG
jgi:flavin-dependent dehydrogenase